MFRINQFVSVIAYVHNNAGLIEQFISTVMKTCEVFKQCEIVFVDDYSTDNSVQIIRDYYTTLLEFSVRYPQPLM